MLIPVCTSHALLPRGRQYYFSFLAFSKLLALLGARNKLGQTPVQVRSLRKPSRWTGLPSSRMRTTPSGRHVQDSQTTPAQRSTFYVALRISNPIYDPLLLVYTRTYAFDSHSLCETERFLSITPGPHRNPSGGINCTTFSHVTHTR